MHIAKKEEVMKTSIVKKKTAGLTLAAVRSQLSEQLSDYVLWIYGAPKIGKTTLAEAFPLVHHLFFEDGAKALEVFKRQVHEWPELLKYLEMLGASTAFKNITIDVVENAYEMCSQHVCAKLEIDHESEAEYGKGWKAVRKEFMDALGHAMTLPGKGCILISHASMNKRKTLEGDEIDDIHPALGGKPLELVSGAVDIIGYYQYRKNKRVLQILGDDAVMAGHRLKNRFLYTDGTPVKYVPMGNTSEEAYRLLTDAFNNKLVAPVKEEIKKPALILKKKK